MATSGREIRAAGESAALSAWFEKVTKGGENLHFPGRTWSRYLAERDQIDRWLSSPGADRGGVAVLATLARVAVLLEKPEASGFITRTLDLHERVRKADPASSKGNIDLIFPLLTALVDQGNLSLASEVKDRLLEVEATAGVNPGGSPLMYDAMIHEFMGDHEAAARSLQAKLDWKQPFLAGMPAQLRDVLGAMDGMIHLRLARNLAILGRDEEARKSLEAGAAAVAAFQRTAAGLRGMGGALPGGGQDLVTFSAHAMASETWLHLGEPARALEAADQASLEVLDEPLDKRPQAEKSIEAARDSERRLRMLHKLRGRALLDLGRFAEAEEAWRSLLRMLDTPGETTLFPVPESHPDRIEAREGLARTLLGQGRREEASAEALANSRAREQLARNLFRYASERQRLSFLQAADPYSLLAETGQTGELAETVVKFKGAVLDSVLEDRRHVSKAASPEALELWRELRIARRLAIQATLSGDNADEEIANADRLEARMGALVQDQKTARENFDADTARIRGALDESDALLEFVQFRHLPPGGKEERHYGTVIIRKDQPPAWVPLGAVTEVDAAISRVNAMASGSTAGGEEELREDLGLLHERLLAPLLPFTGDASRLVISPDGNLSRLSFAVLLDENGNLAAERWSIGYVSTARDLLEPTNRPPQPMRLSIFADPDFSSPSAGKNPTRPLSPAAVPFSLTLPEITRLPGTRKEMEALVRVGGDAGWEIESFSDTEATEYRVVRLAAPTILHFATHGMFFDSASGGRRGAETTLLDSAGRVDDPLQRAFLTLAGADRTFQLWSRMEAPHPPDDGVLNAAEISLLDLDDTWLATLSACDTAVGESRAGEGILGLRRGFFLSGVDHLLMTFWPIADEETVALMTAFYEDLAVSGHPVVSLTKVQRDALVRFREERGLSAAVALAGPFAVSFSGPLPASD